MAPGGTGVTVQILLHVEIEMQEMLITLYAMSHQSSIDNCVCFITPEKSNILKGENHLHYYTNLFKDMYREVLVLSWCMMLQNYQNYNYNLQIICCSKKIIHGILFELIPLMRANINQRNVRKVASKQKINFKLCLHPST